MRIQKFTFSNFSDAAPVAAATFAGLNLRQLSQDGMEILGEVEALPPLPEELVKQHEEQLAAARAEAFAAGRAEGYEAGVAEGVAHGKVQGDSEGYARAKGEQEIDLKAITAVCEIITGELKRVYQLCLSQLSDRQDQTVQIALMAARKVAGDALQERQAVAMEQTIRECLQLLYDAPHATIFVPPAAVSEIHARISALRTAAHYRGTLAVEADEMLPAGDCRVEWRNGMAERRTANIWHAVEEAFAKTMPPAVAAPVTPPAAQPLSGAAEPFTTVAAPAIAEILPHPEIPLVAEPEAQPAPPSNEQE